jgi:hypothetical protein
VTSKWVLRDDSGAPARRSTYEAYFFSLVQDIQARGVVAERLLDPEDDVPAMYGLIRLL